jgi:hypothetical protein
LEASADTTVQRSLPVPCCLLLLLPKLLSCCYPAAVSADQQTVGEVVPLVASLVELERKVFHSQEVIQGGL